MNRTLITIITAALIMMYSTGCASYLVMEGSKKKVAYKRTVARGDQAAIKAFNTGEGTFGIGLDVSNLDALKEQPLLQLGAAFLDAFLIYGSYECVQKLTEDDKTTNDNNGNSIIVTGNDNEINVIDGNENDSNQKDTTTTN